MIALARRFAEAGHDVTTADSGTAPARVAAQVADADAVVLAVRFPMVAQLDEAAKAALDGKVVIDVTNPSRPASRSPTRATRSRGTTPASIQRRGTIPLAVNLRAPFPLAQQALPGMVARRFGRPEEVADLALAVLRNGYLTNQVLSLDGGGYPR